MSEEAKVLNSTVLTLSEASDDLVQTIKNSWLKTRELSRFFGELMFFTYQLLIFSVEFVLESWNFDYERLNLTRQRVRIVKFLASRQP